MKVKITKSGKFSIELSYNERQNIFNALVNFLEAESIDIMSVKMKSHPDVMRMLYYYTLNDFLTNKELSLQSMKDKKITMTQAQAIALMWLLRGYDCDMNMLALKSSLHKLLS